MSPPQTTLHIHFNKITWNKQPIVFIEITSEKGQICSLSDNKIQVPHERKPQANQRSQVLLKPPCSIYVNLLLSRKQGSITSWQPQHFTRSDTPAS